MVERTTALPTKAEMFGHALEALTDARLSMSNARDWVLSDWRDGGLLTGGEAAARSRVLDIVGEVKGLIDEAKNAIYKAHQR